MGRWNPARLSVRWQIVLVLLITQVFAHALTFGMMAAVGAANRVSPVSLALDVSAPFVATLRTLSATETGDTPVVVDRIAALDPRFAVVTARPALGEASADSDRLIDALKASLPLEWQDRVWLAGPRAGVFGASSLPIAPMAADLGGGRWLLFTPETAMPIQLLPPMILFLGVTIVALPLALLSVWAGGLLNAPLARLVRGVEAFAGDINAGPVAPTGPAEVRRAAEAFNAMRARIAKLIGDRSHTLAAISHDMRTPLTRMRLRVEEIADPAVAVALSDDLAVLDRMIDDALTFLRDETRTLQTGRIDLAVLAQTIIDDQADLGHSATYAGPAHLVWVTDGALLTRVLDNLVRNAVTHGGDVRIMLNDAPGMVAFEVSDTGPGIPPDLRAAVVEPFTRLQAVKGGAPGRTKGFGLGLAIANDLVGRLGGSLQLSDNSPKGLRVTVTLPGITEGRVNSQV